MTAERPRIFLVFPLLHSSGERILREVGDVVVADAVDEASLCEQVPGSAAIMCRVGARVSAAVMDAAGPSLRVISSFGSGVDSIDLDAATARGLPVVHARGVAPGPVAEHTIGLMLALAKRIVLGDRFARIGGYSLGVPFPAPALQGTELSGRTVGVIGYGPIGSDVARRLRAGFDADVVVHDPYVDPKLVERDGHRVTSGLDELLAQSDIVTLHCPLSPATAGLIGADQLESVRPGALLINCGRGGLVDEVALVAALESGHVGGAALDVLALEPMPGAHPLFGFPNVIVTPHIAGFTDAAVERLAVATTSDVVRVLNGQVPTTVANPQIWEASPLAKRDN